MAFGGGGAIQILLYVQNRKITPEDFFSSLLLTTKHIVESRFEE